MKRSLLAVVGMALSAGAIHSEELVTVDGTSMIRTYLATVETAEPSVDRVGQCVDGTPPADTLDFNVFDLSGAFGSNPVYSYLDITCIKVDSTEHSYIYVQKDLWGGPLIYQAVVNRFIRDLEESTPSTAEGRDVVPSIDPESGMIDIMNEHVFPLPRGDNPRDVDGRDRFFFVFVDIPDAYPPIAVNGYFTDVNELCDSQVQSRYPSDYAKGLRSNEKECLILDVDPSLGPLFQDRVRGVPAHEFSHLLQWFADPTEVAWLNEGLADLAAELVGYPATGHYDAFFDDRETNSLVNWENSQADYGHAALFVRYVADHGPDTSAGRWSHMEGTRGIFQSGFHGPSGVTNGLLDVGDTRGFESLYRDFSVALLLLDDELDEGRWGFPPGGASFDRRSGSFNDEDLSGIVGADSAGVAVAGLSYGARYVQFEQFQADSVYVGLASADAGLRGALVLGIDGGGDPMDVTPLEVLELDPQLVGGGRFLAETVLPPIGNRSLGEPDRVLLVADYLASGSSEFTTYVKGEASAPPVLEADAVLGQVQVRPNPLDPARGAAFDWPLRFFVPVYVPPNDVTVTIYDVSGGLVRRIPYDAGRFEWDGKNDEGHPVASGLYVWVVGLEGLYRTGIVAVVR